MQKGCTVSRASLPWKCACAQRQICVHLESCRDRQSAGQWPNHPLWRKKNSSTSSPSRTRPRPASAARGRGQRTRCLGTHSRTATQRRAGRELLGYGRRGTSRGSLHPQTGTGARLLGAPSSCPLPSRGSPNLCTNLCLKQVNANEPPRWPGKGVLDAWKGVSLGYVGLN